MLVAVDFETGAILPRPEYPPVPVGVAIYPEYGNPEYLAWGHPSENNCSVEAATNQLATYWDNPKYELVFHNAAFDLDVAETHLRLPALKWSRVHCTQIMAFLAEPEAKSTALKTLAADHLGMEPDEQTELFEWIKANVPEAARKKRLGAYISQAPGKLVGKYAIGDVVRTLRLFDHFNSWLTENEVVPAYDRERKLIPILLGMERRGLRVDAQTVECALAEAESALERTNEWLSHHLKGPIDLNRRDDLADRLEELDLVKPDAWIKTWTGVRQTNHEALAAVMPHHPRILNVMRYHSLMSTIVKMQLRPWSKSGGRIQCRWNSTRKSDEDKTAGARTGRLSSSPNFQNIPKRIPMVCHNAAEADYYRKNDVDVLELKDSSLLSLPPIPHPRECIIPDDGHLLISRDYSQQELRMLAHFAGHGLAQRYRENPDTDMHNFAGEELKNRFEISLARGKVKTLGFGLVYGQAVGTTAGELGVPFEEAQKYRRAYLKALDGVEELQQKLKRKAGLDESFRTWGSRLYWCEEPKMVKGRYMTFEYKMLNTLLQGSSGDHIKETLVQHDASDMIADMLLTVHDEVLLQAPVELADEENDAMAKVMESILFNVPMRSEGNTGTNWEAAK